MLILMSGYPRSISISRILFYKYRLGLWSLVIVQLVDQLRPIYTEVIDEYLNGLLAICYVFRRQKDVVSRGVVDQKFSIAVKDGPSRSRYGNLSYPVVFSPSLI